MSNIPEQPRRPSLEDLLRLKRAERPDAEFWQDFERGLREKQLAAIVEPRPWWLGLRILLGKVPATGWAASGLSAGAAAVFAFMSITAPTAAPTATSARDLALRSAGETPVATVPASPSPLAPVVEAGPTSAQAPEPAVLIASVVDSPSSAGSAAAELAPVADATLAGSAPAPQAPSPEPVAALPVNATILLASADSRVIAAPGSVTLKPLSFLDQAEARLDRITTPLLELVASGFSTSPAMITGFASGPRLAVASTNADNDEESRSISPRHARLLHAAIPYEADEKALSQARDRVVHRLSDSEELYASVTRLGVRGDRLSLSF